MSDGKKLVAAILETGSVATLRLAADDLFDDSELPVWRFVCHHYRSYGELPTRATVEAECRGRLPRADEAVEFYLKKVYDRKLFVALREGFQSLRDSLQSFDVDRSRTVVDQLRAACRVTTPDDDLRNFREVAERVVEQYRTAQLHPGMNGITTGWPRLDEVTGGYQPGDLISWVARMGVGKTNLLLYQAMAAWHSGFSVLIVSMEMPLEQITRRMLGLGTGINPDYIRKGTMCRFAQNRLSRYVENMAHADNLHLYAGSFAKSTADVEMIARELSPDAIYIDGGYILTPDGMAKNASRLDKVASTFDQLKRMTITLNRPIITTSQFSRQAGKRGKDGSLENISFSDAIGMHSSIVAGIKEGSPPFQNSRRAIDLMKGREGEHLEFEINYRFTPVDMDEVAEEQIAAEAVDLDWMA